jgi:two-component system nitrogen regulation response regulator GlnG
MEALKRYPWPGNVRELENLVRRLAALYPQDEISRETIENELNSGGQPALAGDSAAGAIPDDLSIGRAVEHVLQRYFAQYGHDLPPSGLYDRILAEVNTL